MAELKLDSAPAEQPQLSALDAAFERLVRAGRDNATVRAVYALFCGTARAERLLANTLDNVPPLGAAVERACRSRVPDVLDMAARLERMGAELLEELANG